MKAHLILAVSALLFCFGLAAQTQQGEDLDLEYATELLKKGAAAPDFTLNDIAGKPFTFSSLKGRRVVLVFWASWCPDCRAEVPELKAMYEASDPGKVAFVSVSFDREFDKFKNYAEQNALPGVQLFDPSGKKDSAIGSAYHVKWIPSLYLIDAAGKVEFGTVVAAKIAAALKQ